MAGFLSGIKVVSLTHYLQGPSCVQFLADLGCDVVKVEQIGGAYERRWSGGKAFVGDVSVFFLLAGRNQRSIEINIKTSTGQEALWKLIESADVLVENFRPGTLDKFGFSYDETVKRNPRIIYCALTGYGSDGPMRHKPGQDLLLQSLSGLGTLSGRAGDPPVLVGTAVVDQHAATLGALGIMAALLRREQTGKGCKVDSNLLAAGLDLQIEPLNYHLNGSRLFDRSESGISSRFHQAPYGVFKTSDGWLTLSLSSGSTLAKAFDDPKFAMWSQDDQFDKREEVNRLVAEHMTRKSTADWEAHFAKFGVWCARLNDYDDLLADPELAVDQRILEFDDPHAGRVRLLAHPIRYDGETLGLRLLPPSLGQHTDEVLRELGYSEAALAEMRRSEAIGPKRPVDQTGAGRAKQNSRGSR